MRWHVEGSLDILASVHGSNEPLRLSPSCEAALDACKVIAFERSPAAQVDLRHRVYVNDDWLVRHISPEVMTGVRALWARHGLDPRVLEKSRPMDVYSALVDAVSRTLGYARAYGIEELIIERWAKGRRVEYLEAANVSPAIHASIDDEEANRMLAGILDEAKADEELSGLIAAWKSGDLASVESNLNDPPDQTPRYTYRLHVERNRLWMPHLIRLARSKRGAVAVVGAAHLVGAGSLPQLMSEAGMRCEYLGWA